MTKMVFVSDFNFRGSGYLNISLPLCAGLSERGMEIKAVGLGYAGEEHQFGFSIIPCMSFPDAHAMVNNLYYQWQPDIVVVALDIPYQEQFASLCKKLGMKMIAITPLENPPLTFSWAYLLQQIDKVFFISQFGAEEAKIQGVETAEALLVGMDTVSWRMRTPEEYRQGRKNLAISDDTMVVLTVADNQERKNLSNAMEIVSKYAKSGKKVKYILVTREHSDVGWKLRDLAMYYGIPSQVMIFERGISFKQLYALYSIADAFLLTSKAEGLCMPVMEAMSVGVPVVATSCEAMKELLDVNRGFLINTEYTMIDPWGNSRRDFPNTDHGAELLKQISENTPTTPIHAREYMEKRTWEIPVQQISDAVEKLINETSS